MADDGQTQQPKAKKSNPAAAWGITDVQALEAWAGKPVRVTLTGGATVSGHLVGFCQYWLTVKAGAGVVLVNKGQVATVTAA